MFAFGKTCPAQELSCVKAEATRSALNPHTVYIRQDKSNVSTFKHDKWVEMDVNGRWNYIKQKHYAANKSKHPHTTSYNMIQNLQLCPIPTLLKITTRAQSSNTTQVRRFPKLWCWDLWKQEPYTDLSFQKAWGASCFDPQIKKQHIDSWNFPHNHQTFTVYLCLGSCLVIKMQLS